MTVTEDVDELSADSPNKDARSESIILAFWLIF